MGIWGDMGAAAGRVWGDTGRIWGDVTPAAGRIWGGHGSCDMQNAGAVAGTGLGDAGATAGGAWGVQEPRQRRIWGTWELWLGKCAARRTHGRGDLWGLWPGRVWGTQDLQLGRVLGMRGPWGREGAQGWGHGSPGCGAGGLDTRQLGEEAAGEGERGDTGAEEDPPRPAQLVPLSQAAGG